MSNLEPCIDYIRMYLREIGRIPLLTREQEITLGTQVQQMMLLLEVKEVLAKKLRREPTLREWASHVQLSEAELNQIMHRGQRAKQKMVEANLRLVVSVAKKYQKCNMELLDLIQEGTLGLQRGTEKFDPTCAFKHNFAAPASLCLKTTPAKLCLKIFRAYFRWRKRDCSI